MAYTNKTPNFQLPQYIGTDKPTYMGDFNSAMSVIDLNLYTAKTAAETASEISGDNATAIGNINGQINTINTDISTIQTNLTSTTTVANAAYQYGYKEVERGTLVTGLGKYLENYSPTIQLNTTKYVFFEMGGVPWLNLFGEMDISWTGSPTSEEVLDIDFLSINQTFITTLTSLSTNRVLEKVGELKIYTDSQKPNYFSPMYFYNTRFIGDNKIFPLSETLKNVILRPFITLCLVLD